MSDTARILIVCTGNVCRSPFVERLLQRRLDECRPGSGRDIIVQSAGTAALAGSTMDERAAAQLVSHGGDPLGFSARDLTPTLIAESDLVLTATRAHRGQVALMWPKAMRQVFTFRDFADLVEGIKVEGAKVEGANAEGDDGEAVDRLSPLATHTDPRAWVRHVTEEAATRRGLNPPLEPSLADIVDPFRREDEVFVAMAQQIVESMPAVVRALAG